MKNIIKQLNILIITITFFFISCNEKKAVENISIEKPKSEEKFGLTEKKRKELFKEIVFAEDKANEYQRSKQDSVLELKLDKTNIKKEYDLIELQSAKLMKEYKSNLARKFNISEEQEKEISSEGLDKDWPLE